MFYLKFCSLGYKPFLHAIRGQILLLGKLVEQTPPTLQLSTTPVDPSPLEDGQISPVTQSIRTLEIDLPPEIEPSEKKEEKTSDCVLS